MFFGQWLGVLEQEATLCVLYEPKSGIHGFLAYRTHGPFSKSSRTPTASMAPSMSARPVPILELLHNPCLARVL